MIWVLFSQFSKSWHITGIILDAQARSWCNIIDAVRQLGLTVIISPVENYTGLTIKNATVIVLCSCSLAQLAEGEKLWKMSKKTPQLCYLCSANWGTEAWRGSAYSFYKDRHREKAVRSHWLGGENRNTTSHLLCLDIAVVTDLASELAIAKVRLHCMSSCGRQMIYK